MSLDPRGLSASAQEFLTARHLATLTTMRPDGSPHVVPVGFTWDGDASLVRVITSGTSRKAEHVRVARGTARAVVCQFEGWRWISLEGPCRLVSDPAAVRDAERRYAARYREPRANPARVVLEIAVDRVLGLLERPSAAGD